METDDSVRFLQSIYKLLDDECVITNTTDVPLINFKHPSELQDIINFSVDKPVDNLNELLETCKEIIKYSVKTSHPHFFNQLYAGVDLYGLGATWISEALNTNQHTYEIAPAFTLTEKAIIKHVCKIFGVCDGDGIFSPGGSLSNMYGMVLARFKKFPEVKTKGLSVLPQLVCFTSEDAHYSIQKGSHWLGFGTDNLIKIETDSFGRILVDKFESEVKTCLHEGKVPLFLNATVGTTVLGAIDRLNELADVCEKYKIWFHVDACFGGTLILSNQHKHKLKGIERCDSFAWNPHKMLGAPLQCSIFVTKYQNLLHECNSASANYLFQQDKFYDVTYDTGDKSVQCGRKVDAFKLWVMWKARGDNGFEKLIDNTMNCARYFLNSISKREGFRLLLDEFDTTCVCFYYIPRSLRGKLESDEWKDVLYKVAPLIKEKMTLQGSLLVGYSPLQSKSLGNFFRLVLTCQPQLTFADMDCVIEKIEELGYELQFT